MHISPINIAKDQGYGLESSCTWEAVIKNDPKQILYMPSPNRDHVEMAVQANPWLVQDLDIQLIDSALLQMALSKDGCVLQVVDANLLDDRLRFCAVDSNGNALAYIPEDHPQFLEFAKRALANTGWAIRFVPNHLVSSDLLAMALKSTPSCVLIAMEGRSQEQLTQPLVETALALNGLCFDKLPQCYQTEANRALARASNPRIKHFLS